GGIQVSALIPAARDEHLARAKQDRGMVGALRREHNGRRGRQRSANQPGEGKKRQQDLCFLHGVFAGAEMPNRRQGSFVIRHEDTISAEMMKEIFLFFSADQERRFSATAPAQISTMSETATRATSASPNAGL